MSCNENKKNCHTHMCAIPVMPMMSCHCCCDNDGDNDGNNENNDTPQLTDKFNMQIYNKAGVYTFTAPVTSKYKVTVVGAGGGGGGSYSNNKLRGAAGGGGGGGGHAIKIVELNANDTVNITVGTGGAGGASTGSSPSSVSCGATGGSSSFGMFCSATGGIGGSLGTINSDSGHILVGLGYSGGLGIGGDINGRGGHGAYPQFNHPLLESTGGFSGTGGSTILSGDTPYGNNSNGINGILGTGGSGGDSTSVAGSFTGGRGGDGAVLIEW